MQVILLEKVVNVGNLGDIPSENVPSHGYEQSLRRTLPPLGVIILKRNGDST